ncbi:MAG: hypothetical protein Q9227_009280 [Pyrenula ochraceoflavens]
MNADQFREAASSVVDDIISYNASLPSRPVLPKIQPGYLQKLIPSSPPEQPEAWPSIQADIEFQIVPGLTHWQSPNFMAFFPAGVTYPSILGELYSAAFTAPAFNWLCSPACTELETIVMDWVGKAFGLPDAFLSTSSTGGGGVIHGSTSEAIVTVMVAARERYLRQKADAEGLKEGTLERDDRIAFLRGRLVALGSDQAHSSTQKAALIAGTRFKSIPTSLSEGLVLTGTRLAQTLKECAAEGLEPYYLTLTMGTTNTCAVDDFPSIAPIKAQHPDLWIHIDAAYAGSALILPEYQSISKTFTLADSFNMNMHKWLLVNFDTSCLFVQKRTDLTRALSISPSYLQNTFTDSGLVTDYRDWQIPLGRRFRALKVWFVMRSYGLQGMRKHIQNTIDIGNEFADLIRSRDDLFELIVPPAFGLTCLRVKPDAAIAHSQNNDAVDSRADMIKKIDVENDFTADKDQEAEREANSVTKEIADAINGEGEIFITSTTTASKTMLRVVCGNPAAEEKYMRNAFEIIVRFTERFLSKSCQVNGA